MNRQPRAVGPRAVARPLVGAVALMAALLMLVPSAALGRGPSGLAFPPSIGPDGRNADLPRPGVPWSASAVELAHTAKQAVKHGTTEQACTGWRDEYRPPPTIRVLRSIGPNAGHVEVVDFRTYAETVMPAEWPQYWELEALRVGGLAVKQYGWYYTIVYRGGRDASGECYDVRDSSVDQNYKPELYTPYPSQRQAVDLMWDVTLRKAQPKNNKSTFMLTGYRTGGSGPCGSEADGRLLYQWPIARCANLDRTYEQILRLYLEPRLEIVNPGDHDIVGEERGDASVLLREGATHSPFLFEPVDPNGLEGAGGASPIIPQEGFLGARSADMDRDGREDLVMLHSLAGTGWSVTVAESDGQGYGAPTPWAAGPEPLGPQTQLMAGDFDGDSWGDVSLLAAATAFDAGAAPDLAVLQVMLNGPSGPAPSVTWWSEALDLATSQAFAADASGDGRLDLVVARDLGPNGIEYRVAPTRLKGGELAPMATWYVAPDLRWATTRHRVGDSNRDGRDDLWLATPHADGVQVSALKAAKTTPGSFALVPRWTSVPSAGITLDGLNLGSADINFDSMGDLVLYLDAGAGTQLVTLRAKYGSMVLGLVLDEPSLVWERITPY